MKIKYDLQVFYNMVLFKVLEMDEKYRYVHGKDDKLKFKSSNGMEIYSVDCPSLSTIDCNEIFVNGRDGLKDGKLISITLSTNQEAQEYADKIRFALEEWNNHVEIMEIELDDEYFEENIGFDNEEYSVIFSRGTISKNIILYKNRRAIKTYWVDEDVNLEYNILMFNRDCELLNIPFRIKGEK